MFNKRALVFGVVLVFFLIPVVTVASLSNATVEVSPLQAGEAAQYTIGFYVGSSGALEGGRDEVIIYFPEGTVFPENDREALSGVFINGVAVESRSLYFSEGRLIITLPYNVQVRNNDYVGIVISPQVGIKLPHRAGSHRLELETSREGRLKTHVFTIEGSEITRLEVEASPLSIDQFVELEINFRTSSQGRLIAEEDFIYLELAPEFYLPRSIIAGDLEVNGEKVLTGGVEVDLGTNTLRITVPPEVKIAGRDWVEIKIDSRAGIRNPRKNGTYPIRVYTSADTVSLAVDCQVGLSITTPIVFVSPNNTGKKGQYTLGFTTSRQGALEAGKDYLYLEFPTETYFPSSISRRQVTINGEEARAISTSSKNRTVTLTVPDEVYIGAETYVHVVFKSEAGLENPTTAGEYQITVSTSADRGKIKSQRYEISGSTKTTPEVEEIKPDFLLSSYAPGQIVSLQVAFQEGALGDLREGDKLHLIFPVVYEITGTPRVEDVLLNGQKVEKVEVLGQSLVLTIPETVELRTQELTEIKLATGLGLKNPAEEGDYNLLLCSSLNNSPLYNHLLKIRETVGSEGTEQPWVELTSKETGAESGYIVVFAHTAGDLQGEDTVTLTFPADTSIPSDLSRSWLKVNGETPEKVSVIGKKVVLTLPDELKIKDGQNVTVLIDLQAGLENPATAGGYNLVLETSQGFFALSEEYRLGASVEERDESEIVFQIENHVAYAGKAELELDTPPTIIEGRAVVPLRALGDALGAETNYEDSTRTVIVKYQGKELIFYVDSKLVKIDNEWKTIDIPATLINNRVMIPARFVSESYGAAVIWEEETRRVIIVQ